jgi:SAM-dependent methyltransferase
MWQKKHHNTTPEPAGGQQRIQLRNWYQQRLGQRLLRSERRELDRVLPNLFGYYLLQVGSPVDTGLCTRSLIPNRMLLESHVSNKAASQATKPQIHAYAHALPIANDSVDVVLLVHTLEFEQDPHQVLREADRVLVPEGHIVLLGFNPFSPWGLWRLLVSRWSSPPWSGQFRSSRRIRDWLSLLGYDITVSHSLFFRPPVRHQGVMRRLKVLERLGRRLWPFAGAVYLVVARKRMVTMTPIRPRWRPGRSLVGTGLVKPSTQRVRDE